MHISSLADPPADRPIVDSIMWAQSAALGNTATVVAIIAVAIIGFIMSSGKLELRRGITVVVGCFILFGASEIAAALTGFAGSERSSRRSLHADSVPISSPMQAPPPSVYDPYAGASVPPAH